MLQVVCVQKVPSLGLYHVQLADLTLINISFASGKQNILYILSSFQFTTSLTRKQPQNPEKGIFYDAC